MIVLTTKAAEQVKGIINGNPEQKYLRVGVKGGGCSGFQYTLALDETYDEKKDTLYEVDGLQVVVDRRSGLYLQGVSIDYHEDLMKKGFSFTNPNASGKCGCGSSFSM
jgi:iron-sulfur cluster assembly accessory protein